MLQINYMRSKILPEKIVNQKFHSGSFGSGFALRRVSLIRNSSIAGNGNITIMKQRTDSLFRFERSPKDGTKTLCPPVLANAK